MEILRESKRKARNKNTETENNAFDGPLVDLLVDTAEKRITELDDTEQIFPKLKSKEKKRLKKIPRDSLGAVVTLHTVGLPQGEKRKEQKKFLKT